MSNVTYYVAMGFEHDEAGDLVAMDPLEAATSSAAVARARSLAATKAGAVAFSRTGDPEMGEFADAVILFAEGDVPDDVMAMRRKSELSILSRRTASGASGSV